MADSKVRGSLEDILLLLADVGRTHSGPRGVGASRLTGRRVGLALARFHDQYDILVTPTLGRVPVPLEQAEPTPGERRLVRFVGFPRRCRACFASLGFGIGSWMPKWRPSRGRCSTGRWPPISPGPRRCRCRSIGPKTICRSGVQFLGRFGDESDPVEARRPARAGQALAGAP